MSQITWNLPDDLIVRLRSFEAQLPQILELGLRELNASSQKGLNGVADLLEFLASLSSSFGFLVRAFLLQECGNCPFNVQRESHGSTAAIQPFRTPGRTSTLDRSWTFKLFLIG